MPAFPDRPTDDISARLTWMPSGTAVSALAKRLLDLFMSGNIAVGTRLPPERQLAQTLGIGRSAVREALAALEILGIVDVRPGSGTYLRGNVSELLPESLSWGLMLGEPRTRELVEVRGDLEVMAVRLAATRVTDASLQTMRRHLETMAAAQDNRTKFIEADLKFHLALANAAGNQVLSGMLRSIRSLLRIWVERGVSTSEDIANALREHTEVFEALTTRDVAAATSAMERHMATAGVRLNGLVELDAEATATG